MDSFTVNVGDGARKLQGAPLGAILAALGPAPEAMTVTLVGAEGAVSLPLAEVLADNAIRLFTVFTPERVSFAVARTDGTLLAANLTGIEVR